MSNNKAYSWIVDNPHIAKAMCEDSFMVSDLPKKIPSGLLVMLKNEGFLTKKRIKDRAMWSATERMKSMVIK